MTKYTIFCSLVITTILGAEISGMYHQPTVVASIRDRSTAERENLLEDVRQWKARGQAIKVMDRTQPQTRKVFDSWKIDGETLKSEASSSGASVLARDIGALIGSIARSLGYLE